MRRQKAPTKPMPPRRKATERRVPLPVVPPLPPPPPRRPLGRPEAEPADAGEPFYDPPEAPARDAWDDWEDRDTGEGEMDGGDEEVEYG